MTRGESENKSFHSNSRKIHPNPTEQIGEIFLGAVSRDFYLWEIPEVIKVLPSALGRREGSQPPPSQTLQIQDFPEKKNKS